MDPTRTGRLARPDDDDVEPRQAPVTLDEVLGAPEDDRRTAAEPSAAIDREIFAGLVTP